jgi:hypothetical protein
LFSCSYQYNKFLGLPCVCVDSCSAVHIITIYFVGNHVCVDSCSAVHIITIYFVGIMCVLIVVQLFISSQYVSWIILCVLIVVQLFISSQYITWVKFVCDDSRSAVHFITIYFVSYIVCVDSCLAVHIITICFVGYIVC